MKLRPNNISAIIVAAPSCSPESSSKGVRAYLSSLAEGASRASMRSALDQVARILTGKDEDGALQVSWNRVGYDHMAALHSHLAADYAPATANKMRAAVRGVLRNAWQLGQMDTDSYMRAVGVRAVRGSRLPAGRALDSGEIRALFALCGSDPTPAGSRDAAAFALMFGGRAAA